MSLRGKVVVVFGGGGEIGSEVFERLADADASAHRFTHAGCDVTDTASVRNAVGMVWAKHGRLDGLVIAHGAKACIKPTLELTDEEFSEVLDVDLTGTLRVCREAKRYGPLRIVILSSIHAIATYPQRAAYAAAKAGVVGLARALAVEWAHDGTRVNCVLPGQVAGTRRTERHPLGELVDRTPTGELATPECIAGAVLFLLDSDSVNGQALVVDGGYSSSAWYRPHAP